MANTHKGECAIHRCRGEELSIATTFLSLVLKLTFPNITAVSCSLLK